jgi:hypothetical protein
MGNEKHRFAVVAQDILQQLALGVRVKRRGGLVEEHDGPISQQSPRNGNTLSLPLTKSATHFSHYRVKTLGKRGDKVGASLPECTPKLIVGSIRATKQQIVTNRTAEQRVALRNIDKVAAVKRTDCYALLAIVYADLSASGSDKGKNKPNQRGLSSTSLTKNGRTRSWPEIKRQPTNDSIRGSVVSVADIAKTDATGLKHQFTPTLLFFGHLF